MFYLGDLMADLCLSIDNCLTGKFDEGAGSATEVTFFEIADANMAAKLWVCLLYTSRCV